MGDREGMWTTANGDSVVWQPSVRKFVRMRDGKQIDVTTSEEIARRWMTGEDDQ